MSSPQDSSTLSLPVTRPLPAVKWPPLPYDLALSGYYQRLLAGLLEPSAGFDGPPQTIGVTSSRSGEGVSTVAANLAAVASQVLDRNVLLIDAHPQHPAVDRTLGVRRSPGLCDYLSGTDLADCLHETWLDALLVLPAGVSPVITLPQDVQRVQSLFRDLRQGYGLIVVDLPPVDSLGCWLPLAGQLDGALLVVAAERISRQAAWRATTQLHGAGVRLRGAVLNDCPRHVPQWLARRLA